LRRPGEDRTMGARPFIYSRPRRADDACRVLSFFFRLQTPDSRDSGLRTPDSQGSIWTDKDAPRSFCFSLPFASTHGKNLSRAVCVRTDSPFRRKKSSDVGRPVVTEGIFPLSRFVFTHTHTHTHLDHTSCACAWGLGLCMQVFTPCGFCCLHLLHLGAKPEEGDLTKIGSSERCRWAKAPRWKNPRNLKV
jgi:hypothetical protein